MMYAPSAHHVETHPKIDAKPAEGSGFTAKPVQGPADMADLRRKVMARNAVVRAYLAR